MAQQEKKPMKVIKARVVWLEVPTTFDYFDLDGKSIASPVYKKNGKDIDWTKCSSKPKDFTAIKGFLDEQNIFHGGGLRIAFEMKDGKPNWESDWVAVREK